MNGPQTLLELRESVAISVAITDVTRYPIAGPPIREIEVAAMGTFVGYLTEHPARLVGPRFVFTPRGAVSYRTLFELIDQLREAGVEIDSPTGR